MKKKPIVLLSVTSNIFSFITKAYNYAMEMCLKFGYAIRAVCSTVKQRVEKRPILSFMSLLAFLVLVGIFIFLHKSYSHNKVSTLFEKAYNLVTFGSNNIKGYTDIDDASISFLNAINQFFKVSLPLTLTFYYFIYKEQKSISSNIAKGMPLWKYLSVTIFTLLLGYYIVFNKEYYDRSFFTGDYFFVLLSWIFLVILSFIFFLSLLTKLLGSLDINFLFRHKRKKFKQKIKTIYYSTINQDNHYEHLNTYLESIFQCFDYVMEKGLDKLFEHELQEWGKMLSLIMEEAPGNKQNLTITANKLAEHKGEPNEMFLEFYGLLLNKQGDLLFKLVAKNRLAKLNDGLETLKSLEPNKVKVLYPQFITSLDEIILKAYKQKGLPLSKILEILNGIVPSYTLKNNQEANIEEQNFNIAKTVAIIYIYKSILKEAVETDNIKDITTITYSLCEIIREMDTEQEAEEEAQTLYPAFLNTVGESSESNNEINHFEILNAMQQAMQNSVNKAKVNLNQGEQKQIKKIILFVLLQMALKAVELSHYKTVGQLVKRVTTDFDPLTIRNTFEEFRTSKGRIKKAPFLKENGLEFAFTSDSSMISQIYTDILFNKQSIEYCMQKLALLIYGQQFYIIDKELKFTEYYKSYEEHSVEIDLSFVESSYLDYTIGKIKQVGKGYGLLFVEQPGFEEKVKEVVKVTV
ncbi:hypothetical protein ACNHOZ_12760 [Priestia sp. D51]